MNLWLPTPLEVSSAPPKVLEALATGLEKVEDWTAENIKPAIAAAAESIGAKMGALMLPCRIGVTGSTAGADLVPVLELLGKVEVVKRLKIFAEMQK